MENGTVDTARLGTIKLKEAEKLDILKNYDVIAFDIDGTLIRGTEVIEGIPDALDLLEKLGKKVVFVTNNSTKSRAGIAEKLAKMGLKGTADQIYSSSFAAASYLSSLGFNKKVYVVGEEGIAHELHAHGIQSLGGSADKGRAVDWNQGDPHIDIDPEIGAVVVGVDRYISYYKLQYATLCLTQIPDCLFIATNGDARGHFSKSQEWPGAGCMVAAVKGASEKEPVVVGKPAQVMLDAVCKATGVAPERMLVVGDRLDTDIVWGRTHGCGTLLVLTGVTTEEQLLSPSNTTHPTFYTASFSDILTVKDAVLSSISTCVIS